MTEPGSEHIVRVQDGVVCFEPRGPVVEADMRELIRVGDQLALHSGGYWLFADVRHMGAVDAKARRLAAINPGVKRFRGAAIFGSNLVSRALITLIVRGMNMLGHTHVDIRFFDDHGTAWMWLRQRVGSHETPPQAP